MKKVITCSQLILACLVPGMLEAAAVTLFEDGFATMRSGAIGTEVGAQLEYQYLPKINVEGPWAIACFSSGGASQRAWRVGRHNDQPALLQVHENKLAHSRPTIVAGDELWADYTVTARFTPETQKGRSGVIFRYLNNRCYYFCGVEDGKAVLKLVQHDKSFRLPNEKTLASKESGWKPGSEIFVEIDVKGSKITAKLDGKITLAADDNTYPKGKIALTSDMPTRFSHVRVTAAEGEKKRVASARARIAEESRKLQAALPKAKLWKKFRTDNFGVGRNFRFGDLNGDGQIDILVAQIQHHGPKDSNSEVGCLTALTLDGEQLWQIGVADAWNDELTNDVGLQIHDIDGDGQNEVIYCKNFEIIVADGKTGKTKYKTSTPPTPADTPSPRNRFPRILGDSLFLADFRGLGRAGDILIKDRYNNFWAYNEKLESLWQGTCNTGHYPFSYDANGDGKEELFIGYSNFDYDGKKLWSLDDTLKDHADAVAVVKLQADPKAAPTLVIAGSDEGVIFAESNGKILEHHRVGHAQNLAIADFRPDMPGLETVSINFWGNQGIVNYFDANGKVFHEFEPAHHGSMCLPVNWTGKPGEFWILSPNVESGGMYDGWGRKVFEFPADGHPDMCVNVMNLTGDSRDEIVVWDPFEVWIYTQEGNQKAEKLYKPKRSPLYNESNYRAQVSLPGWSDDTQ